MTAMLGLTIYDGRKVDGWWLVLREVGWPVHVEFALTSKELALELNINITTSIMHTSDAQTRSARIRAVVSNYIPKHSGSYGTQVELLAVMGHTFAGIARKLFYNRSGSTRYVFSLEGRSQKPLQCFTTKEPARNMI